MKGVYERYVDINLTREKVKDYEIPEQWSKKYLGGRGIGVRILLEELKSGVDPLGPDNIFVLATGPFQGTSLGGAGRHAVIAKSPKTKSISDSFVGGFFAHQLGRSGYDGIIIRGQASSPKYITLIDGEIKIHQADKLWGVDTKQTEEWLKSKYGDVKVTSIGQAGENLVQFACLINDEGRAAGRPGFGAVMGSKNLKAIAVKGDRNKPIHDQEQFKTLRKELTRILADEAGEDFGKYGTPGGVNSLNELGILPTKNFQEGIFEGAENISGETLYEDILTKRDTCTGCPVRCKRVVETEFAGQKVVGPGPEYETIAALGSLCLNDDLLSIALANQKCNRYGLDTISTGSTIAFAMEAVEKGLLKDLDLSWGGSNKIIELIDLIANREGIGDLLARGIASVSQEMGADFAQEIKGQEIPMHEPRGKKGFGISYATSPRGATHVEGLHDSVFESTPVASELGVKGTLDRFSLEDKAKVAKVYEDLMSFTNSLIMCRFTSFNRVGDHYVYPEIRKALSALIGRDIGVEEMLKIGERNYLLLRLAAVRERYDRKDDDLTKRLKQPLSRGASSDEPIPDENLEKVLDDYYELRGYDKNGKPSNHKLEELGIDVE